MDRVLDVGVVSGRLPEAAREDIKINVTVPNLATRDRKAEAEADAILVQNEAMSSQEMSRRHNLDPVQMADEIEGNADRLNLFSTDGDFVKKEPDDDDEPEPEEDEE